MPAPQPSDRPAGQERAATIVFFGYGSLVNAATLPASARAVPARVRGWRRAWKHSGLASFGRRCTLTVRPDRTSFVDGVVVMDRAESLEALDRRESQYRKVRLDAASIAWPGEDPGWPAPHLYRGADEHARWGDAEHPILMSYLDCVLAGFVATFGEEGARTFMATTDGWHAPVLDDRASPRYPRSVAQDPGLRRLVDALLEEQGVSRLSEMPDQRPSSVSSRS